MKHKSTHHWGRAKARERYAQGGAVPDYRGEAWSAAEGLGSKMDAESREAQNKGESGNRRDARSRLSSDPMERAIADPASRYMGR